MAKNYILSKAKVTDSQYLCHLVNWYLLLLNDLTLKHLFLTSFRYQDLLINPWSGKYKITSIIKIETKVLNIILRGLLFVFIIIKKHFRILVNKRLNIIIKLLAYRTKCTGGIYNRLNRIGTWYALFQVAKRISLN